MMLGAIPGVVEDEKTANVFVALALGIAESKPRSGGYEVVRCRGI
jgi:hypothetical protein